MFDEYAAMTPDTDGKANHFARPQPSQDGLDFRLSAARLVTSGPAAGNGIMNRERALVRLGGNEKLFNELASFFLEDAPGLVDRLQQAATQGKAKELERAAHSLKGLAANFDGDRTSLAAMRIEQLVETGNLDEAIEVTQELVREVDKLCVALEPYRPH